MVYIHSVVVSRSVRFGIITCLAAARNSIHHIPWARLISYDSITVTILLMQFLHVLKVFLRQKGGG